jgi:hypothetical protein
VLIMYVSTFNCWRRLRGRHNVQTWEMSSQAPPASPRLVPDAQQHEAQEALDAYDHARVAAELKQAQAALDAAHSYPGRPLPLDGRRVR